jgi:hypothetical protein
MINKRRRHRIISAAAQRLNKIQRRTRGLGEIAVVALDRKFSKMLPDHRSDIRVSVPESKIDSIDFHYGGIRCLVIVHPGMEKTSLRFDWSVDDGEFLLSRSSHDMNEIIEGMGRALGIPKENIEAALKG